MYKDAKGALHKIKDAFSGYLAKEETPPQTSSALASTGGPLRIDKTMGRVQVRLRVGDSASFVPAGNFTLTLYDCDTEGGTYTAMVGAPTLVKSAATYAAGADLGSIVIPHDTCKKFVKAYLTNASTSTGKVSAFLELLPG